MHTRSPIPVCVALLLFGSVTLPLQANPEPDQAYALVEGEAVPPPDIQMGDQATINRILDEGQNRNRVMEHLRHLSEEIGPRLTGSSNLQRANEWTRDRFDAWGLSNAHLWEWGTVPVRFDRGPSSAKVVIPQRTLRRGELAYETLREVEFTTLAWVPGTDGPLRATIASWPESVSEAKERREELAGSWVLIPQETPGRRGVGRPASNTANRYELWRQIEEGKSQEQPLLAGNVPDDGYSGRWEGITTGEGIRGDGYPFILELLIEDSEPRGTLSYMNGRPAPLENAAFDPDTETLTFDWAGYRGTTTYTFTLKEGTLEGSGKSDGSTTQQSGLYLGKGDEPEPEGTSYRAIMEAVLDAAPAGFVSSSGDKRVWTTGLRGWRELTMNILPGQLEVIVSEPDYDYINSKLASGWPIELEVDADNILTEGPFPVYNTIAEIKGVTKPDEFVIVSAHLDSWNGPGSQGTVDNGTGSSVTLEAARILMAAKAKPDRTIRFVLWSGEEQGLLGSRAYVEAFKEDLIANCSAVLVDDGGTNYEGGLDCVAPMRDYLARATAPINGRFFSKIDAQTALADDDPDNDARAGRLDVNINVLARMPRGGASDHASFNAIGVPGFFWEEVGRADYRYGWHTQYDRVDQAIEEYLVQSATCAAITAYNLACAPELLPRETTSEENETSEDQE